MTETRTNPPRLLTRANLPLTVGAIALVTLGAFENRAVTTALPTAITALGVTLAVAGLLVSGRVRCAVASPA